MAARAEGILARRRKGASRHHHDRRHPQKGQVRPLRADARRHAQNRRWLGSLRLGAGAESVRGTRLPLRSACGFFWRATTFYFQKNSISVHFFFMNVLLQFALILGSASQAMPFRRAALRRFPQTQNSKSNSPARLSAIWYSRFSCFEFNFRLESSVITESMARLSVSYKSKSSLTLMEE